ncbi:hypothetical protein RIF29_18718 [Crotalaria pallida]|uniref:Uncharacterized protein n=1 Tax=Crotalaria pallida TaxID=3830 RepID=A0AAN9I3G6_CROPI
MLLLSLTIEILKRLFMQYHCNCLWWINCLLFFNYIYFYFLCHNIYYYLLIIFISKIKHIIILLRLQ